MARKKIVPISSQQKVVSLVKKPETFVGVLALLTLAVIGAQALKNSGSLVKSIGLPTTKPVDITQPTPVATVSAIPATTSAQIVAATPAPLASIEKLADTSSTERVIARQNDTFWAIAKRTCGSGVFGYQIKIENGYQYKHLQPGDEIAVTCD